MFGRGGISAGVIGVATFLIALSPASVRADTYCVNDPACVNAGGTDSPGVGSALGSAAGHVGDDKVIIGPGTYADGPYLYPGGNGAVNVQGAGEGQTTLTMPVGNPADPGRMVLDINPNVPGSVVSDLTVSLPPSATPTDDNPDWGIFLRDSSVQHVTVTAGPTTTYAEGVVVNGSARLEHLTADFPLTGTLGDTAIGSGGDVTLEKSHVSTQGSAIYQFNNGSANVYQDQITVGDGPYAGQGVQVSSGVANVRDTLIDIGPGLGYGLNAEPIFPGDDAKIDADHVTIVGGGANSVGVRASAHYAVDNGAQSATVNLRNSVIDGAATDLVRFANNPSSTNPGTNTASMNVAYSIFDSSNTQNAANGSGSLVTTHQVGAFASFVDNAFRPAKSSTLVDSGDPNFVKQAGERDLDGAKRVLDGDGDGKARTDLGAYELQRPVLKVKSFSKHAHAAKVRFKSKYADVTQCKLDQHSYVPCTSPKVFKHLGHGDHRIRIRARNSVYHTVSRLRRDFHIRR